MNPREMHGIICDGGASKFSCLVETLNLVRRGLLPDAKFRAFAVSRSQKWPGMGGRQGNEQFFAQLWFLCGNESVLGPKINGPSGRTV